MVRAVRRNPVPVLAGVLLLAGLLVGIFAADPFDAGLASSHGYGYGYDCAGTGEFGYGYNLSETECPPATTTPTTSGGGPGGGGVPGGGGTTTTSTTTPVNETRQIGGIDRIHTSVLLSQDTFANAPASGQATAAAALQLQAGSVVLARADIFPDALAGTPLAVAKKAPLLLTETSNLDTRVRDEIRRILNRGGTVYLLGGTDALSAGVATALTGDGYNVVRFAGVDRYETAIKVAHEGLNDPSTLFLASGLNFPDALCGGAAGAKVGGAILLTQADDPNPRTTGYLNSRAGTTRWALGGPAARAYPNTQALVGLDRYETCTKVASQFFSGPTVAGVASGEKFPDALSGGTHIGHRGGPLVLTLATSVPDATKNYLTANSPSIDEAIVYGGVFAVSQTARDQVNAAVTANG